MTDITLCEILEVGDTWHKQAKCEIESLRAKVAELESDQVRMNVIANNYSALLRDANQQLTAEQSKVKVLTDALEYVRNILPNALWADDSKRMINEALATVNGE